MQLQHCGERFSINTRALFFFFLILFSFQMCLTPSFPLHTGETHRLCGDVASWKPRQPPAYKTTINFNKINPRMAVANQPLKPEVVLD